MYRKKRHWAGSNFLDMDDLDIYNDHVIDKKVEDGVLTPLEGGFLREYNKADER